MPLKLRSYHVSIKFLELFTKIGLQEATGRFRKPHVRFVHKIAQNDRLVELIKMSPGSSQSNNSIGFLV